MEIIKLIDDYDSLVDKSFLALIPECEADVLFAIGIRDDIDEAIKALDANIPKVYIEKLEEADDRFKNIAKTTITESFKLPEGVRTNNWWTNIDRIN